MKNGRLSKPSPFFWDVLYLKLQNNLYLIEDLIDPASRGSRYACSSSCRPGGLGWLRGYPVYLAGRVGGLPVGDEQEPWGVRIESSSKIVKIITHERMT